MRLRRYEILLPLTHNDGRKIEAAKFLETNKELREEFGGFAFDTTIVYGIWVYQGTAYRDKLARFRVDVKDTRQNRRFFKSYKELLKKRFEQEEIWITAMQIVLI
jgi:hypothetical protein